MAEGKKNLAGFRTFQVAFSPLMGYPNTMVIIVSRDWRKIANIKAKFHNGQCRGCSTLTELIRTEKNKKGKRCIIIDGQKDDAVLASLLSAGIDDATVFFLDREKEGLLSFSSSWETMEDESTMAYLQTEFCSEANAPYRQSVELIGSSKAMKEVRKRIEQAKQMDCPIHIYGETGTGKEIAAQLLKKESGALVTANCSEFSETLGPCLLFGVKKGAYTDATEEKGLVESANGASLFLDEIEDLRLSMQSLLLRLLENGTYHRVGEALIRTSRFRLITASNISLSHLVTNRLLRRDLYYRINGMTITMPPLRKHREDIPELVDWFLRQNHESRTVDPKGMELLQECSWSGNVRQLFTVLKQNIAIGRGEERIQIRRETLEDETQPFLPFGK